MTFTHDDIRRMFSTLAPRYDRFNRWSSLGLDNMWRRKLVSRLSPGQDVLDLGCGTGDLTRLAADRGCRVIGLDFSAEMLEAARSPAGRTSGKFPVEWVQASAADIPFPEGRFDAVVSAYVMRNLFRGGLLYASLKEAFRALKPGGRLMFLDLTRPRNPLLRWGHALYMKTFLPLVGRMVCGPAWPGAYLRTSIEELPPEGILEKSFADAGFKGFKILPLTGGIVSLFIADKC